MDIQSSSIQNYRDYIVLGLQYSDIERKWYGYYTNDAIPIKILADSNGKNYFNGPQWSGLNQEEVAKIEITFGKDLIDSLNGSLFTYVRLRASLREELARFIVCGGCSIEVGPQGPFCEEDQLDYIFTKFTIVVGTLKTKSVFAEMKV